MHMEVPGQHHVFADTQDGTGRYPIGRAADYRADQEQGDSQHARRTPHSKNLVTERVIWNHPPADKATSSKAIAQVTTK
jgi:hypothetical protein